jgi:hypothetical protein
LGDLKERKAQEFGEHPNCGWMKYRLSFDLIPPSSRILHPSSAWFFANLVRRSKLIHN